MCSPIFVTSASWNKGELISFWGQKLKGQGHRSEAYRAQCCASSNRLVEVYSLSDLCIFLQCVLSVNDRSHSLSAAVAITSACVATAPMIVEHSRRPMQASLCQRPRPLLRRRLLQSSRILSVFQL